MNDNSRARSNLIPARRTAALFLARGKVDKDSRGLQTFRAFITAFAAFVIVVPAAAQQSAILTAGFDACGEAIVVVTDQGAVRCGSLAAICSIAACAYAEFSGACAVAVGHRKTKAAAGASASMIEAVKAA